MALCVPASSAATTSLRDAALYVLELARSGLRCELPRQDCVPGTQTGVPGRTLGARSSASCELSIAVTRLWPLERALRRFFGYAELRVAELGFGCPRMGSTNDSSTAHATVRKQAEAPAAGT